MSDLGPGELEGMQKLFEHLARLAGYAAGAHRRAIELGYIATAIESEGATEELMSVAQVLKDASTAVKTAAETVKTAIDAAIARLSDNPTAADIAEVVSNLTSAGSTLASASTAAESIDPDAPTGVVADPDAPGEVIEEPV